MRTVEKFWSYTHSQGECLIWHGGVSNGTGVVRWKDRVERAHRVAWQLWHGSPPEAFVGQTCGNLLCCAADHLVEYHTVGLISLELIREVQSLSARGLSAETIQQLINK